MVKHIFCSNFTRLELNRKSAKTPVKSRDFGTFVMVEAAGLEPTVSSTRNWRDTTFATPRNVKKLLNFVVVSYVVKATF